VKDETTALAHPMPEDPTVEGLRNSLAQARAELMKTAAALKQDLTPMAKVIDVVKANPWLSVGAAFALGYLMGRRKD
jgi:ElaB/YqjD/DUF883 family membrane-anchored ribosome-binding protein